MDARCVCGNLACNFNCLSANGFLLVRRSKVQNAYKMCLPAMSQELFCWLLSRMQGLTSGVAGFFLDEGIVCTHFWFAAVVRASCVSVVVLIWFDFRFVFLVSSLFSFWFLFYYGTMSIRTAFAWKWTRAAYAAIQHAILIVPRQSPLRWSKGKRSKTLTRWYFLRWLRRSAPARKRWWTDLLPNFLVLLTFVTDARIGIWSGWFFPGQRHCA